MQLENPERHVAARKKHIDNQAKKISKYSAQSQRLRSAPKATWQKGHAKL